jgi:predicted alpha/beta-fold hydrolase
MSMYFNLIANYTKQTIPKLKEKKNLFKIVTSGSLALIGLYYTYRIITNYQGYEFIFADYKPLNQFIVNKLSPKRYIECPFLPSCLLQMIFNEIKSAPNISYEREYLAMPDDGCVALDWVKQGRNADKTLVLLHGLTGGSESTYIREIVEEFLHSSDYQIVVVNYRGISGSPLLTTTIYHAGYIDDFVAVMKHLKVKLPQTTCYLMGTSMGANIITKFLASHYEFNDYIKGFVSISNPLNCHEVERRNKGYVLDYFILRRQINYIKKHHHILSSFVGKFKIKQISINLNH